MTYLIIKIFFVAFFINLLYELLHSLLYKTCLEAPLKKYIYLILKGATFDGFSIAVIYFISYYIFPHYLQIFVFLLISLVFAYLWETYAIKNKRWEYSKKMPLIFNIGVTPFLQLALTGFLAIYFAFNF